MSIPGKAYRFSVLDVTSILDIVSRQFPAAGVDCLLIGGFAINHYGYTRNTLDVDFMLASDQFDKAKLILTRAGFTNVAMEENVAFFSKPESALRVDLLRVDPNTLHKLFLNAVPATIQGYPVKVPALKDLLAMKIFSLAGNVARRLGKDLPDIAFLTVLNKLDLEKDIRPLCDRFGTPAIFQLIQDQVEGLKPS